MNRQPSPHDARIIADMREVDPGWRGYPDEVLRETSAYAFRALRLAVADLLAAMWNDIRSVTVEPLERWLKSRKERP